MTHRCREKECAKRFSVRTGTATQASNLGYQVWAIAFYLVATNLKGLSSMKLHRDLNIRGPLVTVSSAHHWRGVPVSRRPGVMVDRCPTCGSERIRRNVQRDGEVMALRRQGAKLREIGERYGISIARVSQIIRRAERERNDLAKD